MKINIRRIGISQLFMLVLFVFTAENSYSQGPGPVPYPQPAFYPIAPANFQQARNMAITDSIEIPYWSSGFEPIRIIDPDSGDTLNVLITADKYNGSMGYAFYNVTDPYNPVFYGRITMDSVDVQDAEGISYENNYTERIFLIAEYIREPKVWLSDVISIKLNSSNIYKIISGENIWDIPHERYEFVAKNPEMFYLLDDRLFIASNTDTLYSVDVSTLNTFDGSYHVLSPPSSYPTMHPSSDARIHEVKGYKNASGNYIIGLGLVRYGMCIISMDGSGAVNGEEYQIYEFDRTVFPDTVINPYKLAYPIQDVNWDGEHQHKWDWRACHSVVPYKQGSCEYVLTTDEYAFYNNKYVDTSNCGWDYIDFYMPNDTIRISRPGYPDSIVVTEKYSHRLNHRRRNRPRFNDVDPFLFEGAFLRIWDASKIGTNDLSANNNNMIVNAFDAPEDPSRPEGYVGVNNIPTHGVLSMGVHEPTLIGNRLYLGSYNSGARIFELNCGDMRQIAYCDTEAPLDTNEASDNYYLRYVEGGLNAIYAKGVYRLTPDPWRPSIVYGSDLFHGMWIYKFYDGVFSDTLKHISFQDSVFIGAVSNTDTSTYRISGTFVIHDSAKVVIADNTNLKYDSAASIVVNGELTIGQVNFDTTNVNALSDIQVRNGGTLIFGPEGTLNGLYNVTIDSGGYAATSTGMYMNLKDGGTFTVAGTLEINGTTFNGMGTLHCLDGGKIILKPGVNIHNLPQVTIDSGGTFVIGNDVNVYVAKGRSIHLKGLIDASSFYIDSARFSAYDDWEGFIVDSTTNGWDMQGTPAMKMKHLIISNATTGITTNAATLQLDSCTLRNNDIGILINSSSPWMVDNLVTENATAGMVAYYIGPYDNYITRNRFTYNGSYGVKLYHCGNTWFQNIIDDNYGYGLYCDELVTARFNLYWTEPSPGYTDCSGGYQCSSVNDSLGNSFRGNHNGIRVADLSFPTFECHNSVDSNSYYDFILIDTATVIGCSNYNHTFYLKKYFGGATASLVWDDALFSDPVPLKTASGPQQQRMPKDNRLFDAIVTAKAFKANGEYTNAATAYGTGVQYLRDAWEAEYLFAHWQQVFQDAEFNKPTNDPMSRGFRGKHIDYKNALLTLYGQNGRPWLKHTAGEFLGDFYMRNKDYNAALPVYQYLAGLRYVNPKIARRALMAQVILKHRGFNDYDAAYDVYEQIEQYYPRTNAVIFAKIDLGLPLDSIDRVVMMTLPKSNGGQPIDAVLPSSVELYQSYPNPFNPTTTISYAIPEKRHITLTIHDALGRFIESLEDDVKEPGYYQVEFDGSAMQSGTYYYRLTVKEPDSEIQETLVKQMVLVK